MDRGVTIENPYASVSLPRAQLKDGFLRYYLGEDQGSDTVFYNPSSLPTYSATQEKVRPEATEQQQQQAAAAYGPRISTRESWARPYNPYASLRVPSGASPEPFYWRNHHGAYPEGGAGVRDVRGHTRRCCCCCPCCRKCCACGRRCPCVVS